MEYIKTKGYSFVDVADPLSLFSIFRRNVKGAVIYESDIEKYPERMHKLNALTLYCALNDAVLLTEEMNVKLQLPVLIDARNRLNSGAEAYDWAYRELWPKANHKLVAFAAPSRFYLKDYLVVNKVMPIYISKEMDSDTEAKCMRFFDEAEPNSPVIGCWAGYGEIPAGRIDEPTLQRMTSERGLFLIVAEASFNLSFHSGMPFNQPQKIRHNNYPALDPARVYLCFTLTDGDNLQYIEHRFLAQQWWGDPNRGKIPIAWTMNPCAIDLIPDMLEYLISTSTPNDEFVCSGTGLGIISPSIYGKKQPAREIIYNNYIHLTAESMKKAGFAAIQLCDTSGISWGRADFDRWGREAPNLSGILGDYGQSPVVTPSSANYMVAGGIPVARALGVQVFSGPNEQTSTLLADSIRRSTPKERPAFMHVSLCNWYSSPTIALEVLGKLWSEYAAVTPEDFFYLMKMPVETRIHYQFAIDGDSEGWGNAFDLKDMSISDGMLKATTTGPDPNLIRGKMNVQAESVDSIRLRMMAGEGGGGVEFFWATDSSPIWDAAKSVRLEVAADGKWHEYVLPVSQNPEWKGTIVGIRLDPTCLKAGIPVAVDYIIGERDGR